MILDILFFLPIQLFSLFVNVFPMSSVNLSIASALDSVSSSLWALDSFIPVSVLLQVLGIIFSVEIIIFTFKGIRWVLSYIPFFGGSSS